MSCPCSLPFCGPVGGVLIWEKPNFYDPFCNFFAVCRSRIFEELGWIGNYAVEVDRCAWVLWHFRASREKSDIVTCVGDLEIDVDKEQSLMLDDRQQRRWMGE